MDISEIIIYQLLIFFWTNSLAVLLFKKTEGFGRNILSLFFLYAIPSVISFFFPIPYLEICFLFANILLLFILIYIKKIKLLSRDLLIFFFLCVINYPLLNREIIWYDTYLYHLNQVKIVRDYGFVFGSGLVHERLGFSSISIQLGAFLDAISYNKGIYISNSFIFNFTFFFLVKNFIQNRKASHFLLLIFFLWHSALKNINIDIISFSTDFHFISLAFVFAAYLLNEKIYLKDRITQLFLFSVVMTLLKVSGTIFTIFLFILLMIEFKFFWRVKTQLVLPLVLGFLIFAFQALRSVISTGWLYYPIPIFSFDLEWSLSLDQVVAMNKVIKAWAIYPGVNFMENFIKKPSFFQWFPDWIKLNANNIYTRVILLSAILLLFRIVIWSPLSRIHRYFFLFIFLNLAFYFVVAPDYRFFSSIVILFLYGNFLFLEKYKWSFLFVLSLVCLTVFYYPNYMKFDYQDMELKQERYIPLRLVRNESGLRYYQPLSGDQCGDSPIPCTPYGTSAKFMLEEILGFRR